MADVQVDVDAMGSEFFVAKHVGWTRAPRQKPSRWGSVLADDWRGGSYSS